jgi:hypothetical protein
MGVKEGSVANTTVDKVKTMFRGIEFKAANVDPDLNTAITIETVEDWIDDMDAEIDGLLSDYYVVPVTGVEALKIIGRISKYKTAHLVKTVLESLSENSDKNQLVQTNLEMKANDLLDQVIPHWDDKCCEWIDPRLQLTDASQ